MPWTTKPGEGRANLEKAIKDVDKIQAKVGWFESAKYPDGTPVAYVATIQEHGAASQGIPPRPFFRPTIAAQSANWSKLLASGVKAVMEGRRTAREVLTGLGLQAEGDVRKTISQLTSPALKAATIAQRKRRAHGAKAKANTSTKPLVDSGLMIGTLTSVVEDKK